MQTKTLQTQEFVCTNCPKPIFSSTVFLPCQLASISYHFEFVIIEWVISGPFTSLVASITPLLAVSLEPFQQAEEQEHDQWRQEGLGAKAVLLWECVRMCSIFLFVVLQCLINADQCLYFGPLHSNNQFWKRFWKRMTCWHHLLRSLVKATCRDAYVWSRRQVPYKRIVVQEFEKEDKGIVGQVSATCRTFVLIDGMIYLQPTGYYDHNILFHSNSKRTTFDYVMCIAVDQEFVWVCKILWSCLCATFCQKTWPSPWVRR